MAFNRLFTVLGATAIGLTMAASAMAVPNLQIYIEGATYCGTEVGTVCPGGYDDAWAIDGTVGLRLWIMADSPVYDVHLVASYNQVPGNAPQFIFKPRKVGDAAVPGIITNPASAYPDITDTEEPVDPLGAVFYGGISTGGLGNLQLNEGKYNPATRDWYSVALGDMNFEKIVNQETQGETRGADLVPPGYTGSGGTGTGDAQNWFQLNVYDITFNPAAAVGQIVNFGVWATTGEFGQICTEVPDDNHTNRDDGHNGNNHDPICVDDPNDPIYVSRNNSHDGQWRQIGVPEPASMTLLGAGLVGLGWLNRRRKAA